MSTFPLSNRMLFPLVILAFFFIWMALYLRFAAE